MAKRGFNGAMTRAYGAKDHQATVTAVKHLAPHFLRVRFHSDTLLAEVVPAPTAFLRFWFPDPADPQTEHQRAYTLSDVDPQTGDFAVDVVLHEPAGPASAWMKQAAVGDTVSVTTLGSSRFDLPDELPAGYLLIGDSASLPAINAILEVIPPQVPVELYLEEHHEYDHQLQLTDHPRATVHWVPRRGEESLAASLQVRDWSNWYAWAAPESGSLKHLRTRLRDEFGFPKGEIHAQAYWYYGRAFGSRRPKDLVEPTAEPQHTPSTESTSSPEPEAAPAAKGNWKAAAAGKLLAGLKPTLIIAGILQAVITLVQLAPFVLLTELARLLLAGAPGADLWTLGFWAVGLMGAGVLLSSALFIWLHAVDASFAHQLRRRLLDKLAKVPLGWFDARSSGQVKQVIQDDTLSLHYLVTHAVPDAVAAVTAPVAVLIYLFVVDWRIALVLLIPVLTYIVAMAIMVVQSGPRTGQAARWAERMNSEAGSYLEGQPVIRVFGGGASSGFRATLDSYLTFLHDWQRPLSGQKTMIDLVTRPATFLLLICVMGTWLITAGAMAPVQLLPFLLLGTTFGARLLGVGYGLAGLRAGIVAARRIQNTLDETELETADNQSTGLTSPQTATRVDFEAVQFAYRPGVPVLHDVTLSLEPGTVTALVGPSGSGKSTLASLLARFHDVTGGAIRLNGRELRTLDADQLYSTVGFVFQQTQAVSGTIHDNIALAVPEATRAQVQQAAADAQLHERITRLPDGYDTVLDGSTGLSGGELQRLTIARALLADTPVLVLDEATAFADPESEYEVQRALDRLTAGRTVLVIAHRLHTITGVDRIVVLEQGRVAESGTHAELLSAGGRYQQLWEAGQAPASRTPHTEAKEASR
ncbi:ABC transporter ATP-binding protein/permease [Glutamicibacter sp. NPDC087344]|uniref:ABC transporter ATP-binding protein/permease n=1 Tax=Glutamicibacter sp. NPDC087344 TaxID=3363994 RepID=UPI0038183CB7